MKWQTILLTITLLIFLSTYDTFGSPLELRNVPKVIQTLIFQSSKFAEPIKASIEKEDRLGYEYTKENPIDNNLIPSIVTTWGYNNTDRRLLSFLVKNGYVTVESLNRIEKGFRTTYNFLLYTEKLRRLISNPSSPELVVAHRKIKSIDYTNEYKGAPAGIEVKFYALTFSYTFSQMLDGLPGVDTVFKGKAKAYLNPDDGEWKLVEISLEDRGWNEYFQHIQKNYEPFSIDATANVKGSTTAPNVSLRSIEGVTRTSIKFINNSKEVVNIYWKDYQGDEKFYNRLAPGKFYDQQTFVTHPWIVRDQSNRKILLTIVATETSQVATVK